MSQDFDEWWRGSGAFPWAKPRDGPRFASVRRSRGLKPRLGSTRVLKNGTRVSRHVLQDARSRRAGPSGHGTGPSLRFRASFPWAEAPARQYARSKERHSCEPVASFRTLARAEPALQGTGRGPRFASVRRSRGLKPRLGSTRVLKNGTRVSPSRPSGPFLAPSRPFQGTDMQNAGADANAIAL